MKKRLLCFFLAAALTLCLFTGTAVSVEAAVKQEKTRAIAIVFDNSGSMYGSYNSSWCRATYAMEVFAAMMNDGDQLLVYPMWPITMGINGGKQGIQEITCTENNYTYTQDVLTINGPGEASKISQIYSPTRSTTPFHTVTNAYEGLKGISADEKYLIVITDGEFDGSPSGKTVTGWLDQLAQDVNVMFMGINIGDQFKPDDHDNPNQYYVFPNSSSAVLSELTTMCNKIFGRDELTGSNKSGNQINFDVSMGKIIILVQGEGIENVSLSGGTKVSDHVLKYSDLHPSPDRTLQGMLVTYKDLDAGTYDISYSGNDASISVYYEPDVDLTIQLIGEGDVPVDVSSGEISAGTYRLQYGLVDKYGKPTNSSLLGDQYYDLTYTANGTPQHITDTKAGSFEITLEPDTKLEADFLVQYLKNYTIRKDNEALGWPPYGLSIVRREVGDLVIQVTGGSGSYVLSTLEEDAVYDISILHEGVALTAEELEQTALNVELTGGNAKTYHERTDSGYRLFIRYNGDASSTDCGDYTLNISATYTLDTTGQSNVVTKPFTITDDSTAMGISIELSQDFYQITKIEEGDPIYVYLTMGGAPMESDVFNATTLNAELPGVDFDLQPDAANSRYILTLKPGDIQPGKYTLTATASGLDEIGRAVSVQDSVKLELRRYPPWLPGLITFFGLLVLALLIWLYLNTKILPKHIGVGPCTFIVDGDIVTGTAKCTYTGKNKRRGTLTVQSPHYGANPAAKCGYTLDLEAISPRRTRSSARSVQVVNVRPMSASSTIAVQIGGCNLSKDPISGKLMKAGGKPGAPLSFKVGNKAKTSVTAEVMDMANGGGEVTVSLSAPLKFL